MKRLLFTFLLLHSSLALAQVVLSSPTGAERQRYVNTASTPGGDGTTNGTVGANRAYAGLYEALTTEFGLVPDLVAADVWLHITCSGTVDNIVGYPQAWVPYFTTDRFHFIQLDVDPASRHEGKLDLNKYVLKSQKYAGIWYNPNWPTDGSLFIRIIGFQILLTVSDQGPDSNMATYGISLNTDNQQYSEWEIRNNLLVYDPDVPAVPQASTTCVFLSATWPLVTGWVKAIVVNNICEGWRHGFDIESVRHSGFLAAKTEVVEYNNTCLCGSWGSWSWGDCYYDRFIYSAATIASAGQDYVYHDDTRLLFKNNIGQSCTMWGSDPDINDYCGCPCDVGYGGNEANCVWPAGSIYSKTLTSDGSSPDSPALRNKTIAMEDFANHDYRLSAADTAAKNVGDDLSVDINYAFTTDGAGRTRPIGAEWDIGYYEAPDRTPATFVPSAYNLRLNCPFNWNLN